MRYVLAIDTTDTPPGAHPVIGATPDLADADYLRLLTIRTRLREFERWSADQAAAQGLTANQHQLLLAVRGHAAGHSGEGPTVGQVADYLFVRHNTAVELANRTEAQGLVRRVPDPGDGRVVRLVVTADGAALLAALSAGHAEELARLLPMIRALGRDLRGSGPTE